MCQRMNLLSNSPKEVASQKATGTSTQQPLLFAAKMRLRTSPPKLAQMNGERSTNTAMSWLRRSRKKKRTSSKSSSSRSKMLWMSKFTLKRWKKRKKSRKPERKIRKYLRQRAKDWKLRSCKRKKWRNRCLHRCIRGTRCWKKRKPKKTLSKRRLWRKRQTKSGNFRKISQRNATKTWRRRRQRDRLQGWSFKRTKWTRREDASSRRSKNWQHRN